MWKVGFTEADDLLTIIEQLSVKIGKQHQIKSPMTFYPFCHLHCRSLKAMLVTTEANVMHQPLKMKAQLNEDTHSLED